MRWSWRLGRIAGIDIYMHGTFLILIAWVAFVHWLIGRNLSTVIQGVLFIIALFACVILHELGHAMAARKFGIPTRDITLLPIGGVARVERMPDDPREELLLALSGPAVNIVIAIGLFVLIVFASGFSSLTNASLIGGSFFVKLMWVNVLLAGFNMLPAFPMDGGRALRALLTPQMGYLRATQLAAAIGQGMAFLFGFLGLLFNPLLLFIAFFVYMGAAEEAALAQMRWALGDIPVMDAMVTDFRALSATDSLERAIEHVLTGCQRDFPVLEGDRVVGVLTRQDLLAALGQHSLDTLVREVMRHEWKPVDPMEPLERVFEHMQACGCPSLPVVREQELIGMITLDNIGEFIMIQTALSKRRG